MVELLAQSLAGNQIIWKMQKRHLILANKSEKNPNLSIEHAYSVSSGTGVQMVRDVGVR